MRLVKIDNYILNESVINILYAIKKELTNGKLKDIHEGRDDIVVTCPKHSNGQEKHPDCNIYIGDNPNIPYGYARCFACDFKGYFEYFVAECFDSSVETAKKWLIDRFGEKESEVKILDDFISINNVKNKILDESILEQYQHWTPYLAKRKLDREICEKFKIRYDPKNRQVIFPIYTINGKLKMLAKRSIDTKFFHMDANQEKEVYGLNIIQKNNLKRAVICEGPFDCITSYMYGIPAIATLGTPSLYQVEQINKSCLNCLYLCMDNDEAGKKFTTFLKQNLSKRILLIDVNLPKNKKDINDLNKDEYISCINSAK